MESAELVEMYKTLLPIAKIDFGKEVFVFVMALVKMWINYNNQR